MVGQHAVVGQCDVFFLPLFIQRAAAALPEDALRRNQKESSLEKRGSLLTGSELRVMVHLPIDKLKRVFYLLFPSAPPTVRHFQHPCSALFIEEALFIE